MVRQNDNYKWFILTLVVLTDMFVIAIPTMGISVLSKEISDDLGLNLVQLGVIWGVGGLPGIVTGLLGGMIGDKIGPRRVLIAGTLLGGLLGMARGLAFHFVSMVVVMFFLGAVAPIVLMNSLKAIGEWFPSSQLGLANGIMSMGMALGFLTGSLFSATTFSPFLGGWRNVLIAYGLIAVLLSIPWMFTRSAPEESRTVSTASIWTNLKHVAGLKNIWLLGMGLFGISGAVQGTLGYLPLYLREAGWQPLYADSALSVFHTVSLLLVLPVSFWSDRLGSRKRLLLIANLMIMTGTGLLGVVHGLWVWVAVVIAGSMRDTFMATFNTMVIETPKVGPAYAGTAIGLTMALASLSNFISPPVGNSLASLSPGAPFVFWSALSVFALVCLSQVQAKAAKRVML
ncbi:MULTISPECIES: nitrate/nitrite transporter [Anaerolinea]|uniref:MFS transporter n=1 Tax=Anaerolinea TaxID=233189 RepID=UPI002615461C|nr:MFS transporter [Anaerolinea thermophila]